LRNCIFWRNSKSKRGNNSNKSLQFNIWYEKVEHPAPVGGALVFKVYVGWSYCSVGKKFLQYLVSLIGFARMDFSEQYLLEGEAQDVRNDVVNSLFNLYTWLYLLSRDRCDTNILFLISNMTLYWCHLHHFDKSSQ
jgi:hypothetical protein